MHLRWENTWYKNRNYRNSNLVRIHVKRWLKLVCCWVRIQIIMTCLVCKHRKDLVQLMVVTFESERSCIGVKKPQNFVNPCDFIVATNFGSHVTTVGIGDTVTYIVNLCEWLTIPQPCYEASEFLMACNSSSLGVIDWCCIPASNSFTIAKFSTHRQRESTKKTYRFSFTKNRWKTSIGQRERNATPLNVDRWVNVDQAW